MPQKKDLEYKIDDFKTLREFRPDWAPRGALQAASDRLTDLRGSVESATEKADRWEKPLLALLKRRRYSAGPQSYKDIYEALTGSRNPIQRIQVEILTALVRICEQGHARGYEGHQIFSLAGQWRKDTLVGFKYAKHSTRNTGHWRKIEAAKRELGLLALASFRLDRKKRLERQRNKRKVNNFPEDNMTK